MRVIRYRRREWFRRRYFTSRFSLAHLQLFGLSLFACGMVVGSYLTVTDIILPTIFAATSPWTQTDWSGGVASGTVTGTVNTYETASDVNTSSGQVSLSGTYGDVAVVQGTQLSTSSTNFNVGTFTSVKFNSSQRYNDSIFSYDAGSPTRLTVDTDGNYLVSLNLALTSDGVEDSANRSGVEAEIRVNGTKKDVGQARSTYIRNYSGHHESSGHLAVLLENLSSSDYIEIFVIRSTNDTSHPLNGVATVYAEKIADSETIFSATATRTVAGTDLNGSASPMQWSQGIVDSGYTHTDGSQSISLDSSGKYLVAVNVPLGSTTQRANVTGKILLDGAVVNSGEFQQGYIRSASSHYDGSIHWFGVVESVSSSQVLTVTMEQEGASGTVTVDGEKATLFIQKLPSSGVYVGEATQAGGSSEWNPGSKSAINWATDNSIDSSTFSHSTSTNNHQITVLADGDYLLGFGAGFYSAGQRVNPKITVQVNGSDVTGIETKSGYIRASSGHNESSDNMLVPLSDLSANDVITVSVERESTVTNTTTLTDTSAQLFLWRKGYASSGSVTSNIFDAGFSADWGTLSWTNSGSGTVIVKVRSDSSSDMSGATDWASCSGVTSGNDISANSCVTDTDQYLQYQVSLAPSGISTPVFEDISIGFTASDLIDPTTNASDVAITGVSDGAWTNTEPTLTWSAGADDVGGSGLAGYCVSLDEATIGASSSLDPESSSGKLTGIDDGISNNSTCPFIVAGTTFDLSGVFGLSLTSGKQYYFSLKAVDLAGNVWSGVSGEYQDLVSFKYDATAPSNPSYFSMPSDFISTKSATLIWPTSGGSEASDDDSGVAGLQYRIGSGGTWYGDNHNGNQDESDLLVDDGSYTTDPVSDYDTIEEGSNLIYLRTWDNAGNASTVYLSGALKVNSTAPSTPLTLVVTPETSTSNSFAFSWEAPVTYTGQVGNITYCYTINTLPTSTSCNWTSAGETTLAADAYANQPGENTLYLVAKDEAGNVNYDTYASAAFTANTSAPGIPQNIDIADVSVKATESWKLAISWEAPASLGAGVASYEIYHSTDDLTYVEESSMNGISYVDTSLTQTTHYYKVRACDSANNCGAFTQAVSLLPDGKFTDASSLTSGPTATSITTKKATISWGTDRTSDSKVAYGTGSGSYYSEEPSNSTQTTDHTINLTNLSPGTTYYYKAKWTDEDGNTGMSEEKTFTTESAPSVKDVEVTNVSISSALINFTVSGADKVKIYYGETTTFGGISEVSTSSSESTYSVQLTGLADGTKYYFKINAFDVEDDEYDGTTLDFETLPRPKISLVKIQQVRGAAQPTVLISWNTNTAVSSIVTYFPTSSPGQARDEVNITLQEGKHQMILRGLLPNTPYSLVVKGRDIIGNEASSEVNAFTTATDTRSPQISNLHVEGSIVTTTTNQTEQLAQVIVTWNTDEASTSQVEFGEGTGTQYSQRTQEDENLTFNHLVIISNLTPSKVYHLRAISQDEGGNEQQSIDTVTITPKGTDNALDLVIVNLREVFGFLQ